MKPEAREEKVDLASHESPHFQFPPTENAVQAWEEVEEGRFMPRRIRGSCTGRALG